MIFINEMYSTEEIDTNTWKLENILMYFRNRFSEYESQMDNNMEIIDESTERLYKSLEFDLSNIDYELKYSIEKMVFNIYNLLKSEGLTKDEIDELKYFVLIKMQGYMCATHRCISDIL